MPERTHGYRPELDVVRFLAFLLVFLHHFLSPIYWGSASLMSSANQGDWRALASLENACAMGLCLFFSLSAYLITDLLLDERERNGGISIRNFYVRRALRIWPLYFAGIGLGLLIAVVLHQGASVQAFTWYLLFAGNFFIAKFGYFGNPMMPLWSISIEEQFYLVWPWAIRWLSRRWIAACALLLIALANITLCFLGQHHADTDTTVWANTTVQFEMFATGILLALAKKRLSSNNFFFGPVLVLAGPVLWFVACYTFHCKQQPVAGLAVGGTFLVIGYAMIALGCAAILQGFCAIGSSHMPQWAAYLGRISYGLYVYHLLAIEFVRAFLGPTHGIFFPAVAALLALLLTVVAAIVSYTYLEAPFLRLKRRFEVIHSRPI